MNWKGDNRHRYALNILTPPFLTLTIPDSDGLLELLQPNNHVP
jgi:hypothetical protein